jgi:putative transposase
LLHLLVLYQREALSAIIKRYGVIGLESLNVKGMLKNHSLAKSVTDAGFYEFRRQLTYKAAWNGKQIVEADQFFPIQQNVQPLRMAQA